MQNSISYIPRVNQTVVLNEICRHILKGTFPITTDLTEPRIEYLDIPIESRNSIMGALNLISDIYDHHALNKLVWDKTFVVGEIHHIFQLDDDLNEFLIRYFYYRCLFIMGDSVANETIYSFFLKITKIDLEFLENIIFFREKNKSLPINTLAFISSIYFNVNTDVIEQLKELYTYLKRKLETNTSLYFFAY